ncbi:MAG: HAMP domain-containing histidine kinase [Armatimonadetes bacterium]|nr:HAMP domain-containing histidine kinase [Armatimonadota bacterium]
MDEELSQLISETVNTRAKLDVLRYFHENPFAWESLAGLARRLYRAEADLEPALVSLTQSGLLQARATERTGHGVVYNYSRSDLRCEVVDRLLQAYRGPDSRQVIEAVAAADRETRARDLARQRELEDLQTRFVSMVSHELRTPVTAVHGILTAILKRDDLTEPEIRPLLERALAQCDRLASTAENLLLLSGVQATGRLDLYLGDVEVPVLIAETLDELRREGMDREITCELPDMPVLVADEYLLGQALKELLSNAVKFSDPGSRVTLTAAHDAGWVRLAVADEGTGIEPRSRERVFQAFYQEEADSSRRAAGLGLGLYVTRLIAEQHGGRVDVETKEGAGTTVSIHMPVAGPTPEGQAGG